MHPVQAVKTDGSTLPLSALRSPPRPEVTGSFLATAWPVAAQLHVVWLVRQPAVLEVLALLLDIGDVSPSRRPGRCRSCFNVPTT